MYFFTRWFTRANCMRTNFEYRWNSVLYLLVTRNLD